MIILDIQPNRTILYISQALENLWDGQRRIRVYCIIPDLLFYVRIKIEYINSKTLQLKHTAVYTVRLYTVPDHEHSRI